MLSKDGSDNRNPRNDDNFLDRNYAMDRYEADPRRYRFIAQMHGIQPRSEGASTDGTKAQDAPK